MSNVFRPYLIEKSITDFILSFIIPNVWDIYRFVDVNIKFHKQKLIYTKQVKDLNPLFNLIDTKYVYLLSVWKIKDKWKKLKSFVSVLEDPIWYPIHKAYRRGLSIIITAHKDRIIDTYLTIPESYQVLFETNILEYYIKNKWTKMFSMFYNKYKKYYEQNNIHEREFLQQTLWKYYKDWNE